jgi:ATP-dependent Clp protease ATP-binding subunit ClpX
LLLVLLVVPYSLLLVELVVDDSAINIIAQKAIEKGLGARGLHSVLDEALLNAQFEVPSLEKKPSKFTLDSTVVMSGKPRWVY